MHQTLRFYFLVFSSSLLWLQQGFAQSVSNKHRKDFEEAKLAADAGQVEQSIGVFQELIEKYPTWLEPRETLGRVYYENGMKNEALTTMENALALDTISQLRTMYTVCRLYEETDQPTKAMKCFEALIPLSMHEPALSQKAIAGLQALEEKKGLNTHVHDIEFKPVPGYVNSAEHDVLGRWTLDGKQMVFTRLIDGQEDMYIAELDSTGMFAKVKTFYYNTNANEGAHAISPDGRYLIYTACNRNDGLGSCDLYISNLRVDSWTSPRNMGNNFNTASWDAQPCFGRDGQTIYFSSARPGGYGGRDIWYVRWIGGGNWSSPINAGPGINTTDNEESPFVHFDENTIYFMRDGKSGLGGFDLYIARKGLDGKWEKAENMGRPINTSADEGGLAVHPDGKHAVIARVVPETKNDLFLFELPEKFRALPQQALHVYLTHAISKRPLRGQVELFEVDGFDTVRISQPADEDGRVTLSLTRGKNYGVMANADQFLPASIYLTPDSASERTVHMALTPIAAVKEEIVVLENIHFETGSASLRPASKPELEKLFLMMIQHPDLEVEIRGHTDNVGDAESNKMLSELRAKVVYGYLISRGIGKEQVSYVGFGEEMPVTSNETEEGRRKNRRTEFRVVAQ